MASLRKHVSAKGETTWSVLYRHGRKQPSRTFATKKAAASFAALVNDRGPDEALRILTREDKPATDALTVDQLAAAFLAWKQRDVTERTMTDYRRDITNWITPHLGHKAADSVDEGDVQKWVDHMALTLSPKSVADRHMLLHAMYQYGKAKSRGLVTHNPCLETDLPKRVKKPPKGTSVPEFRAIHEAATRRNQDAADLILFLAETGWRFSEATALDVRDVEDDGTNMWVTVTRVMRIDGHGRQHLAEDTAKSDAAFRRINMWPASTAMIRRRIGLKRPGQLVFTNTRGRPWNQNTFLRDTWPNITADAQLGGQPPMPKTERVTAATVRAWAVKEGIETKLRGPVEHLIYRFNQAHEGEAFYAPRGWNGANPVALGIPLGDDTYAPHVDPIANLRHPTPHELRHMHAAVCLASGMEMHEVQRRLGHEHYSTTADVYSRRRIETSGASALRAAAIMAGAGEIVRGEVLELG